MGGNPGENIGVPVLRIFRLDDETYTSPPRTDGLTAATGELGSQMMAQLE
jgi:hypothetical protein